MKTAVSVPDDVYERAERLAARLGRSRSALYAEALRDYLERQDAEADDVTARLDEVYAGQDSDAVVFGARAARRLVDDGRWTW